MGDDVKKTYEFYCPMCGNRFVYDSPDEPMCTGPGVTDDHYPELMHEVVR